MEKTAIVAGLVITVFGLIGIVFFHDEDGPIAITGSIIFGAGLIARAIGRKT